ncbi:hypothetical protein [Brevibacillus choshinensis]|nr:hypothetical protein [Brevibacillus choshinensis]
MNVHLIDTQPRFFFVHLVDKVASGVICLNRSFSLHDSTIHQD